MVRPRLASLHRAHPPLAALLYLAGRDGRLVWRSADEFAVLEPPAIRRRDWVYGPHGTTWHARLGRWWSFLVFAVPPVLLMVLSVPAALAIGKPAFVLIAAAATLYVVVQMVGGLAVAVVDMLVGAGGPTPRFDRAVASRVRSDHWMIALFHLRDPAGTEWLLRAAFDRAAQLATSFRPDPAEGSHAVVCFEQAITTRAAREAVAAAPSAVSIGGAHSGIYMITDGGRFRPPRTDAMRPESGLALLLLGVFMSIAVSAWFVAEQEQQACSDAGDCADRPTSWGSAVLWLMSRLFFQDSALSPATWQAQLYGYLLAPLALVVVGCFVAYGWRYRRYVRLRKGIMYEPFESLTDDVTRILVLVALDVEREAVIRCVSMAGGLGDAEIDVVAECAVFRIGRLGDFEIVVAQSEQGTVGPAAMTLTANALIDELKPHYVILTGICFGLWSREHDGGDQEIGDVVVSTQVHNIDHRRVTDQEGVTRVLLRGDRVQASPPLLSASRAAAHTWYGPLVHHTRVLSSNISVHDRSLRRELQRLDEEAGAGEMELAGVQAVTVRHRTDWIMIKGISDWGLGDASDEARESASLAAASYVVHVIVSGGLARRHIKETATPPAR